MRAYSEENKRLTQRVTGTQKEFSELQRKYHEIDANHISLQVRQSTYVYIYIYVHIRSLTTLSHDSLRRHVSNKSAMP